LGEIIMTKTKIAKNMALGCAATIAAIACSPLGNPAFGGPLALAAPTQNQGSIFDRVLREPATAPRASDGVELPAHLRRQVVDFRTTEQAGTIIIDTPNTYLYYVLGGGKAIRYGIGVGREGFTWSGVETVSRMAEWPDWTPPPEMIGRQPYLPRFMAGGPGNPLGARALYLGNTAYRIHGTNDPSTIGHRVSSGCIRLTNEDVSDLYRRVRPGGKVIVLPGGPRGPSTQSVQARNVFPSATYR
jgi:lipoprotein-anchoring transpeptidase ErfK/SrfK